MQLTNNRYIPWLLALVTGVVLLPGLGVAHLFDWDEINFAEIAREMTVSGNYSQPTMRFLPFWEKPPLFFWLQALGMEVFGVGEFAARLPNVICGMITIPLLYTIGRRLFDETFGMIWAMAYLGALLPGIYFQSGIIDPVFNLFIFLSLVQFVRYVWKRSRKHPELAGRHALSYLIWAAVFAGLAVMTKGPAALLVISLCMAVFWVMERFRFYVSVLHYLLFVLVSLLVSGLWYGTETVLHGTWFISQFIDYNIRLFSTEDAGHGGFFGYHFVVVLFGCFPSSLLMLPVLFRQPESNAAQADWSRWMRIMLWVVLILFSVVQSKIVHYSSLTYFPVSFLAALSVQELLQKKLKLRRSIRMVLLMIGSLLVVLLFALPVLGMQASWLQQQLSDPFAIANLKADAGWNWFDLLPGLVLLTGMTAGFYAMRKQLLYGLFVLFVSVLLTGKTGMVMLAPKVEAYTQRAAVEFFSQHRDEDAYLAAIGYKTYADAFYGRMQPAGKPRLEDYSDKKQKADWDNWLLAGNIDRPVYFITRMGKESYLESKPDIQKLYEKNGFLMYYRLVPPPEGNLQ